jgi:permuted papain-like amidase YaeF/Yiix C92 family enzyme
MHQPVQPLGVGNFSGKGLMGKVMGWTSRELPSSQTPLSEEERQRILEKIQPGDILLTYASHRPNLGHLEYWTTGANYTHCALYEGYGRIVETLGDQVTRSPLVERLEGPIKVAVVRPPYKSFRDRAHVVREAKKLIGTPYDYKFDNSDQSELYCSEFIEVAMKRVDPDLDVPDASFLGREITSPDAFADMKGAKLIHDGRSNYWSNQRHQWPMYLGAAVGAGLGAAVGGPLGAVVGSALGFEGTLAGLKLFSGDE